MNFELKMIALVSGLFLLAFFGVAWATEKGLIPKKLVRHPAIYVLSLGIYASCWSFYGSIGITFDEGYSFLATYLGISGAFLLAPALLVPLLRITSSYQLSSLPDLLAFRFRSPTAGTLSTLLLLGISMPLMALQIQAIADSTHLVGHTNSKEWLVIMYCAAVVLFTLLFGTRHLAGRQQHHGLVFTMALGSLLKLSIMLTLGAVVVYQVFDGPTGLNLWLEQNPIVTEGMNTKLDDGPWRTLLLMFFASAVATPHMFHMIFTENREPKQLYTASWGLPLFLLLLSFSTPLILWAGIKLGSNYQPEYYSLAMGLELGKPWLTLLAYFGGIAAATSIMVVTVLALSSMLMNHVLLPLYQPKILGSANIDIYRSLTRIKRGLVIALVVAAYIFYQYLEQGSDIRNLGVVAYAGAMQLLPATLCTLYWKKANRQGFIWGLLAGTAAWFVSLLLPMTLGIDLLPSEILGITLTEESWHIPAATSLALNGIVLYLVSSWGSMSPAEHSAAEACLATPKSPVKHQMPQARSACEFQEMLSTPLGSKVAQAEVTKALRDLNMQPEEHRPQALRRLRDRIETNLSGLMGPSVALEMVESFLPLDTDKGYVSQDMHFIESQLEAYHSQLTGLAAELDGLRRYHRETLHNLPMAVCSVDNSESGNHEVMLWNHAMAAMTGIASEQVLGHPLSEVPAPWNYFIGDFLTSNQDHLNKYKVELNGSRRYFNLHKARVPSARKNQVMLLEDHTEAQAMEEQLFHNERLASIGQLAAGVAHEIGNPITGIDCLAQELKFISDDPEIKNSSNQILEQTKRVSRIVQSLVTYAHTGQRNIPGDHKNQTKAPVDLVACVDEAISLLKLSHKNDHVVFINDCHTAHQICGSGQKLQQVFINLLSNASDASEGKGSITISTFADEKTVTVQVEDQGHGIPESIKDKLFDPFFTTKMTGKGTGLGLALTWNIIKEHSGTIQVVSPVDTSKHRGTRFIMTLPRFKAKANGHKQEMPLADRMQRDRNSIGSVDIRSRVQ